MRHIFDSHAHYDDKRFAADRDAVLSALPAQGIDTVVNIGCDMATSRASIALAERYDFVYATVGVHPHEAEGMQDGDLDTLRTMLSHPKVKALGEIGLDYHYDFSPREIQRTRFSQQLELAQQLQVPVVLHQREATADCLDIVSRYRLLRGVFHCFSGSRETAETLLDWGYYLSFGGIVTFPNARRSHEVLQHMPRERLLIETDCPYLSPVPHRGKRCDSSLLPHTIAVIADLWGISPQEVADITAQNARTFYGISTPDAQ